MKKIKALSLVLATGAMTLSSACAIKSITPGDTMEINMDFDMSSMDMRHGWAFFTAPQLKYVGHDDPKSIQRGKVLFTKHCQKCHGETGVGDGPEAKKMNIKPANLQGITNEVTNTYLVVQINDGKGAMPRWQDILSEDQSYDLTNYIRTLGKK